MFNFYNILIPCVFFLVACTLEKADQDKELAIVVKKAPVIKETVSASVFTSGILVSDNETRLAFKVGGIVNSIAVQEGQSVEKDQTLAALNLSEIKAQVALARNQYEKAMRDLNRVENLYRDSVATLEQKQNAKTAADVAHSNLQIAEFNLMHAVIRAPARGIILKKFVETNELVSPGQPVFVFGSSGKHWRVKVGIPEKDFIKLSLNDSAYVSFDAYPGVQFPARIVELAGAADPYTGTFEAEIQLDQSAYRLISGFIARVKILTSRKHSYHIIPLDALFEADGTQASVFYLEENGAIAKKRWVELGPILGTKVAIRAGLEDIKEVITAGNAYLYEGASVTVTAAEHK
jgi:multidrug efflux system membrane fusion protein